MPAFPTSHCGLAFPIFRTSTGCSVLASAIRQAACAREGSNLRSDTVTVTQNLMFRAAIIGAVSVAYVMLSASSAVAQKPLRQDGDVESGQLVFNNACRTCHTTREGDNRFGPHLYKIIGRKAGSVPNYHYSSAMKGADFIWDEAKLNRFIASPDEMVPGNSMKPFGGLASAEIESK